MIFAFADTPLPLRFFLRFSLFPLHFRYFLSPHTASAAAISLSAITTPRHIIRYASLSFAAIFSRHFHYYFRFSRQLSMPTLSPPLCRFAAIAPLYAARHCAACH